MLSADAHLLRRLADNISSMLAYWDAELRCRFANRAYERWFGKSPESLLGKHISELLGPIYELNLPYIEAALRGEPQEFERVIPDPAGGPSRHSLASYIPDVVAGVVRGFFVVVTDISAVKHAELALRESEERFRTTLDEAPIGMAVVGVDGRFVRVNRALCEIVGYTAVELTGLTFQAITHPDDLDADLALVGQLARGEISRYNLEKRYLRKDGSVVDIMLSGSVVRGATGEPLYYIAQIQDVSQSKRLLQELRLAEAQSSGILSISPDAIVSIDEEQRITMFNEGAENIFGYAKAEVLGAPLEMLLPEALREAHRRHVSAFAAGEITARRMGEGRVSIHGLRKNGEVFPGDAAISKLDVGGKRIFTVALRDVTEQQRIEHEQRFLAEVGAALSTLDYEETLTRIAELAVRDLADLCVVDVVADDSNVRRQKVASRDPALRSACDALGSPARGEAEPELLWSVAETRRSLLIQHPTAEDIARLSRDEQQRQLLLAARISSLIAAPLVVREEFLGVIVLALSASSRAFGAADLRLTEELAHRAALSIANARLYHAAQRATQSRDEVLGVVAHDLRNPLNSILIQASLLRRHASADARSEKPAANIERAALRMNRLIGDLLDVSRLEAGRLVVSKKREDARKLVGDCVEAQKVLASAASVELRVALDAALSEVFCDRDRALQVLENLIGNALKFTPSGGRVSVGAAPRGREVLFWVSDTGTGIAAENLPHLFDRFWQVRPAERSGAGLGLSIAKGLIEAHGGRIWAESTLGQGSTFFFTLPAPPQIDTHANLSAEDGR